MKNFKQFLSEISRIPPQNFFGGDHPDSLLDIKTPPPLSLPKPTFSLSTTPAKEPEPADGPPIITPDQLIIPTSPSGTPSNMSFKIPSPSESAQFQYDKQKKYLGNVAPSPSPVNTNTQNSSLGRGAAMEFIHPRDEAEKRVHTEMEVMGINPDDRKYGSLADRMKYWRDISKMEDQVKHERKIRHPEEASQRKTDERILQGTDAMHDVANLSRAHIPLIGKDIGGAIDALAFPFQRRAENRLDQNPTNPDANTNLMPLDPSTRYLGLYRIPPDWQ